MYLAESIQESMNRANPVIPCVSTYSYDNSPECIILVAMDGAVLLFFYSKQFIYSCCHQPVFFMRFATSEGKTPRVSHETEKLFKSKNFLAIHGLTCSNILHYCRA
ncbi:hypothetical protein O6H91_Y573100 [Diphasiastrum complanatum]|nr:hypothetical protein O6H91_Y573100 [Diphasiastrum complanatum]